VNWESEIRDWVLSAEGTVLEFCQEKPDYNGFFIEIYGDFFPIPNRGEAHYLTE
jgi:hypothetical protein